MRINTYFVVIVALVLSCSIQDNEHRKAIERLKKVASEHYEQRNYSEAYNDYAELVKLDSSNNEFHFRKARAAASLKLDEEARKGFLRSIEKKYREADSYYNIGLTYLFKDNSLATNYFEECLKIEPNHQEAIQVLNSLKENSKTQ